jgi:hypothetical protein
MDLFTLIGMMATIAGIFLCLFFLFAPTTFGAPARDVSKDRSPDLYISMRWLQPALGQAIVEDALIRQRRNDIASAATLPDGPAKPEAGSVQWIMGRVVVELNRSRLVGRLPGDRQQDDQRIVMIARHAGEQFQEVVMGEERTTRRVADHAGAMF